MARQPRLSAPGLPHHVIQRGNNRQTIFSDAVDCERFLTLVGDLSAQHGVAIHAFVLMPNHVHLLMTPAEAGALSRLMQALGRGYVAWYNKRHARTGTLWEGRYRASVVESEHYLFACSRYIEMNPVRAGLVADPADYRWSSYRHHIGLHPDPTIREHPLVWSLGNTPFERQAVYRRLFEQPAPLGELEAIRAAVQGGWAVGRPEFVSKITAEVGRRAARGRPGRPRKASDEPVPK